MIQGYLEGSLCDFNGFNYWGSPQFSGWDVYLFLYEDVAQKALDNINKTNPYYEAFIKKVILTKEI